MLLQISKHAKLEKKPVDDVLGGEEAWKNVQKTDGELCQWCSCRLGLHAAGGLAFAPGAKLAGCVWEAACLHTGPQYPPLTAVHRLCCHESLTTAASAACVVCCVLAVTCANCSAGQAYFMEVQIRSADEPATIFYKCVDCAHIWREG